MARTGFGCDQNRKLLQVLKHGDRSVDVATCTVLSELDNIKLLHSRLLQVSSVFKIKNENIPVFPPHPTVDHSSFIINTKLSLRSDM